MHGVSRLIHSESLQNAMHTQQHRPTRNIASAIWYILVLATLLSVGCRHSSDIPPAPSADAPPIAPAILPSPVVSEPLHALTLVDAVQRAIANSEHLAIAEERTYQAVAQEDQVRARTLPTVSLDGQYRRREDREGDGGNFGGFAITQDYYLAARQPLFSGFRAGPAKRAAAMLTAATVADHRNDRHDVALMTIALFHAVLYADQQLTILNAGVAVQKRLTDELQKRVDVGDARRADLLLAGTELAKLTVAVQRAQEQRHRATVSLADAVGLDPLPALTPPSLPDTGETNREHWIVHAQHHHPKLAAAYHRITALRERVDVVRREALPDVDLEANYYGQRDGFLEDVRWDVQVLATIPLFSGWDRVARKKELESQLRQAELTAAAIEREITVAITETLTELAAADQIIETLSKQVQLAGDAHADIEREVDAGTTTQIELLTALNRLIDARLGHQQEMLRRQFLHHKLRVLSGQFPIEEAPQ